MKITIEINGKRHRLKTRADLVPNSICDACSLKHECKKEREEKDFSNIRHTCDIRILDSERRQNDRTIS